MQEANLVLPVSLMDHPYDQTESKSDSLKTLLAKAKAGEPQAVQDLFDQYADLLLKVIRARMTPEMRSAWDSVDFLQLARFKLHGCNIEDKDFETPQAFLAYMIRIAQNEVGQVKRQRANRTKGNVNKEVPIETLTPTEAEKLVDREPKPEETQMADEQWRRALQRMPALYRAFAVRLRDGYTHKEIAAEFDVSERTVGRALNRLKEELLGEAE